jgi:glutamine amidotransferase
MIAIIDYDMGNIRSVQNALNRLGAEWTLTADKAVIAAADRVILPGVGNAGEAMRNLIDRGLVQTIRNLRRPVLGVCVGMQVLCRDSEESAIPCLGIFDAHVTRFNQRVVDKVPHMGWNTISNLESKLFAGMRGSEHVYFVHSYRAGLCTDTIATCRYGEMFSAALKYENFYGTQFHPEKSGDVGERIISNFLKL